MKRTSLLFALAFVASCLEPEQGINHQVIRGFVTVGPFAASEASDETNGTTPEPVTVMPYGFTVVTGEVQSLGAGGDVDVYAFTAPTDATGAFQILFDGGAPVVDDPENPPTPPDRTIKVQVFDVSAAAAVLDVDATYGALATLSLTKGSTYQIWITGKRGTGSVPYEIVIPSGHPNDAGLLVGAYPPGADGGSDVTALGPPVGGSSLSPFIQRPGWKYEANYQVFLIRSVSIDERDPALTRTPAPGTKPTDSDTTSDTGPEDTATGPADTGDTSDPGETEPADTDTDTDTDSDTDTDTDADTDADSDTDTDTDTDSDTDTDTEALPTYIVDEALTKVFLYVGDWANLNAGLLGGTFYSGTPAEIDLTTGFSDCGPSEDLPPYEYQCVTPAPLVVDTVAEAVIGQELVEVEPNTDVEPWDMGSLSGVGLTDIVTGELLLELGYWEDDTDGVLFTIPEDGTLNTIFEWADCGTDLDYILFQWTGSIDTAVPIVESYYGCPELAVGIPVLEGQQYVSFGAAWVGAPGVHPWTLTLEMGP